MSDIVERLKSQSILDVWHPMMLEAADEIERQRKVISATIEDIQYLKDKQIEAADEIEKLRAALNSIEAYVEGRVIAHRDIAELAGSSASGKKQRVRLSEADDILGKLRTTRAALKEAGDE